MFGLYGPEFENVKESWFLIMLFTDIPKVTRMAQFALTSSHQRRIPANVAVGMAQVTFVLFDTSPINLTLTVGTSVHLWDRGEGASGRSMWAHSLYQVITIIIYSIIYSLWPTNSRLEELATYAVITVIVDFLIFMSFYPAGLSLVIELMFNKVTEKCFSFISRIKKLIF